ncbi:hypothetical protein [Acidocella sp.]|uniref:hypothetical protein n=1 Tax=Acidocella sp. TaxID=50710 RepID=UPI00260C994A|nr:hypothetical protein [Acidocella sp.]
MSSVFPNRPRQGVFAAPQLDENRKRAPAALIKTSPAPTPVPRNPRHSAISGMAWLLLYQIPGTGPHYKLAMREGNGNRIVDLPQTNMHAAQRHASTARPCCRVVTNAADRLRN